MNFEETLDFLYKKLPMYQRVGKAALKKDLTNTKELLHLLGNPHQNFKSVHIAGTNGKGTSAHAIAAIMQSSGYKTGLYTSPHLKRFTERIKINGSEVSEQFVIDFVDKVKPAIADICPSFFEITVAMAFLYFSEEKVDIAIVETGLGGRLDSTNVIVPEVSLITNIGFDHTDLLGDSLEKIAAEKAGIIKNQVPVVIGSYQKEVFSVFKSKAEETQSEVFIPPKENKQIIHSNLPYYKSKNAEGVRLVIEQLRNRNWVIPHYVESEAFHNFERISGFKGRYQVLQTLPKVIADISHNKEGLEILFEQVCYELKGKLYLIFGTVVDKPLDPIFQIFPMDLDLTIGWTQSSVPRSLPVSQLHELALKAGVSGVCYNEVNAAISSFISMAQSNDTILITGSTFLIAEIESL
jgi:dihydrofolate synthase/folylpolyglutamate synthase